MFQIIDVDTNTPVIDTTYPTADDALRARESFPNVKTRIQRIVDDSWILREQARLDDGTYTKLPQFISIYTKRSHYAHVAKKDPTKIAFTESPEKGMRDVQTVIPASTYLGRFAGDLLSAHEIRDIAARYEMRDKVTDSLLTISFDRKAFRFAYNDQPVKSESSNHTSCMAKPAQSYTHGSNLHPAEAYATDEQGLAIAYTVAPDNPTSVTARAVVWPTNMSFVKVYGLEDAHRIALIELLRAKGYTRYSDFIGAPLARIPVHSDTSPYDSDGEFLMPYIDGEERGIEDCPDDGRFFICDNGRGDYIADETCGVMHVGDRSSRRTCDNCGDRLHRDDVYYVNGDTWCQGCYDNEAFNCAYSGESYSNDRGEPTQVWRRLRRRNPAPGNSTHYTVEETWALENAQDHAFYCEHNDQWYASSDFTAIEVTVRTTYTTTRETIGEDGMRRTSVTRTTTTTQTWCLEDTEGECFLCPDCEEYFATDMAHPDSVGTPDGLRCHECWEQYVADMEAKGVPLPSFVNDPRQLTLSDSF